MGNYHEVLWYIGSDYSGGRLVVYFTLTLCVSLWCAKTRSKNSIWLAGACGALICLMISTVLLSVIYIPIIGVFYFLAARIEGTRDFKRLLFCSGAGFAVTFLGLCLLHFSYTDSFWYLANSVTKATQFMGVNRRHNVSFWHGNPFNILAFVLGMLTLLDLLRRCVRQQHRGERFRLDYSIVLQLPNVLALIGMTAIEFGKDQELISNFGYFDHTIPLWFLALAGVFSEKLNSLSLRLCGLLVMLLFLGGLAILWCKYSFDLTFPFIVFSDGATQIFVSTVKYSLLIWCSFVFGGLSLLFCRAPILSAVAPTLTVLFCNTICMPRAGWYPIIPTESNFQRSLLTPEQNIEATVEWLRLVNEIDPDRKALLWFSWFTDQYGPLYRQFSAASHFWQMRLVNQTFPKLRRPIAEADSRPATIPSTGTILIMSSKRDAFEAANVAFLDAGRQLWLIKKIPFSYQGVSFSVYLCGVRSARAAE
jgi:hypothetical protein